MGTALGKRLGYTRVSSKLQNLDRQLDGVAVDKLYAEKVSAKDTDRPELQALLDYARDGDTIVVHSMDRLARNLDDLRRLVRELTARGVAIEFVKEQLTFRGDDTPMATLLLSVMGAFAEFERALIKERQLEGIALAKEKGKYTGGRKRLSDEQIVDLRRRADTGESKAELARQFNISRETVYQYLRRADCHLNPVSAGS